MEDLPYTLSFPSLGFIVVHAGLVPGVPLDSQDPQAMSSMRNVVKAEGNDVYEARADTVQGAPPRLLGRLGPRDRGQ